MATKNTRCQCLYHALGTTRAQYRKEEAKKKYLELISTIIKAKITATQQKQATKTLDTAKRILGDITLERIYSHTGLIDNRTHNCEEAKETLELIRSLDENTNTPALAEENEQVWEHTYEVERYVYNEIVNISEKEVTVDKVIDHRFRNKQLKLAVIINPGSIKIIENEERVTQVAGHKVFQYLKNLRDSRPRRLNHILRMKPDLIQLFATYSADK